MKNLPLLLLGLSGLVNAQNLGDTPYAALGLGDRKQDTFLETSAMGGISTAYVPDFNNTFNFRNPANNRNLDLTSIRLEATNENFWLSSGQGAVSRDTRHTTYLSHLSIAFPVSRQVKFGLSYQPYSTKSYTINVQQKTSTGIPFEQMYTGKGTLNQLTGSFGYSPLDEVSFGFRTNFRFGVLTDTYEGVVPNVALMQGIETSNKILNWNFTAATTWQKKMYNEHKFTLGGTYTFGNLGRMESLFKNSTYFYQAAGVKVNENSIEQASSKDIAPIPQEISLGAGYGRTGRWFLGTQFDYRTGTDAQSIGRSLHLDSGYRMALGGWMLPNANNFRSYFSRVVYRGGLYYEKTGLQFNQQSLDQYGLTFGASFPFQNAGLQRFSALDLGLEMGRRGSLEGGLIQQNFINLKVGIHFADRWFGKTLYD